MICCIPYTSILNRCFSAARVDIIPLISIPYIYAVLHFFDDVDQAAFYHDTIATVTSV